jgi:hypothetical protein
MASFQIQQSTYVSNVLLVVLPVITPRYVWSVTADWYYLLMVVTATLPTPIVCIVMTPHVYNVPQIVQDVSTQQPAFSALQDISQCWTTRVYLSARQDIFPQL